MICSLCANFTIGDILLLTFIVRVIISASITSALFACFISIRLYRAFLVLVLRLFWGSFFTSLEMLTRMGFNSTLSLKRLAKIPLWSICRCLILSFIRMAISLLLTSRFIGMSYPGLLSRRKASCIFCRLFTRKCFFPLITFYLYHTFSTHLKSGHLNL